MSSVEIWWGQTSWSYPAGVNLSFGTGGLQINGNVSGPGCGCFSCDSRRANLTILGQYFLSKDRMPEGYGYLWSSRPEIAFGAARTIGGWTLGGAFVEPADQSSAKCTLKARQLAYQGGQLIASSEKSQRLINISNRDWETREYLLPHTFELKTIFFPLDRTQDLEIDVAIDFDMDLEGSGRIFYNSIWDVDAHLQLDVPQWLVYALEPPP